MTKLIYAVLLLAVWYGGVKGDASCFLQKISECSQKLAVKIPPEEYDFMLCKHREELFTCIRESAVECKVDQRYNFDHVVKVYNAFCTDGYILNLEMKKHKECIVKALTKSYTCAQVIIDFANKIKEFTPEVIKELGKLSCRERKNINSCYLTSVEDHCGKLAKNIYDIFIRPSESVNELICQDILNE